MSLELRWFFDGPLPKEIREWCLKQGFEEEMGHADTYLVFPSNDLGVKSREGKLEIKYLISVEELDFKDSRICGMVEMWEKSSASQKSISEPISRR